MVASNAEYNQNDSGYASVNRWLNTDVKVYLSTGAILCGRVEDLKGKYLYVAAADAKRQAIVNLDHVTSITRI